MQSPFTSDHSKAQILTLATSSSPRERLNALATLLQSLIIPMTTHPPTSTCGPLTLNAAASEIKNYATNFPTPKNH